MMAWIYVLLQAQTHQQCRSRSRMPLTDPCALELGSELQQYPPVKEPDGSKRPG